jgi:signal transduction histidine kinase
MWIIRTGRQIEVGAEGHGRGAGVGMYSPRRLVEAHGGDIHAESERGQGTRITFTLPRQASRADGLPVLRGVE